MTQRRSGPAIVASALLGVIAVAAFVTAGFMAVAAWATSAALSRPVGAIGSGAALWIGLLLVGFSALAALTARASWLGHAVALPLGLTVSTVAVLAAVATMVTGGAGTATPLLYLAILVGSATVVALLAGARSFVELEQGG